MIRERRQSPDGPARDRKRRSITPRALLAIAMFVGVGVAVLLGAPCAAQQNARVVHAIDTVIFDNSREQFWSPYDAGFFGYSELAVMLRGAGFLVTESNLPVTASLQIEPKGSVLVMGPASGQRYTAKEVKTIAEYVRRGGGLLILAEADAAGGKNFQNTLASEFGITFVNVPVVDSLNSTRNSAGQWIFANSNLFDIDSVSLPVAISILATTPARSILSAQRTAQPSGAILGAATTYGDGRVICIGDSQFLINGGNRVIGLDCANNRAFARALFNWLTGRDSSPATKIVPEFTVMTGRTVKLKVNVEGTTKLTAHIQGGTVEPSEVEAATGELSFKIEITNDGFVEFVGSDGSRKTVVLLLSPRGGIGARLIFDARGYGAEMADPINGLSDFAALMRDKGYWVWAVEHGTINLNGVQAVVVANPLRSEDQLYIGDMQEQTRRWILIGDPHSTINVHNAIGEWFRKSGFSERKTPIQEVADNFYLTFLPAVIFEPNQEMTLGRHHTFPILKFGVEKCHAFRCGIVRAEGGLAAVLASPAAWGLEGGLGVRPDAAGGKPAKYDYTAQPIAVALSFTGNAAAIADLHLLTSQHLVNRGNWSLALALGDWMAGVDLKIPGADESKGEPGEGKSGASN